jgi:hypothetical protein
VYFKLKQMADEMFFLQLVQERDTFKQELQLERRAREDAERSTGQALEELDRVRRALDEAESSTRQAREELQRMSRACQEGDDQIRKLKDELQRERSA